jgi:hypothetical protein
MILYCIRLAFSHLLQQAGIYSIPGPTRVIPWKALHWGRLLWRQTYSRIEQASRGRYLSITLELDSGKIQLYTNIIATYFPCHSTDVSNMLISLNAGAVFEM